MSPDQATANHGPWWKGERGEWLVVAQIALMGLLFLGPRTIAGHPAWPFPLPQVCAILGPLLIAARGVLLIAGLLRLGRGLTPLPYPKDDSRLAQTGPYAIVRHPMYSGGLILGPGWALYLQGWLTLAYVVVLFAFLDMKSRREEKWLVEKFPDYPVYQRRVHKLIPFVY